MVGVKEEQQGGRECSSFYLQLITAVFEAIY